MIHKQVKRERRWWTIPLRLTTLLLLALIVGVFLNWMADSLDRSARPAGFARGVVQGALMPMALPNLLFGHDVIIYSANNNGVRYKLGYTAGVNGCGAFFFGALFWGLTRSRKSPHGGSDA